MKVRYINPLVKTSNGYCRLKDLSESAKEDIEKCMNYRTAKYLYLDFEFLKVL